MMLAISDFPSLRLFGRSLSCACGRTHAIAPREIAISERDILPSLLALMPRLLGRKSAAICALMDQRTCAAIGEKACSALRDS
ncbi:MAG: hypothetical protein N3A66_11445, partial [Planctomycetota bacterium]|nr:hypothetical protein [Planctomycetota bacterium]